MEQLDDELVRMVRARVGTSVCGGKYTIDSVLGIGGMAAVYAGTHRNGRSIAMKLLHPEYSRRADIRKRFLREGQAANAVQHRGVVAVIDDDIAEDGAAFVVMERLEGRTLEHLWEELGHRLPTRAVLAIGRELCEVLAVAHRAGIIHRDLKPENLFLTNDGELKILDFGLAQLRDAARPTETQTGMVFGTPAYMPPEQASGQTSKIDARTDLWAVGATMFTLLSGELVHRGETAQHFVMLAATEPARSLSLAMPQAHPALVALVDRALAREKEQRWQSADSMREAIVTLSEMLLGEPETPLMTPIALVEAASARRAKRSAKAVAPVGDLTEETLTAKKPLDDQTLTDQAFEIGDSGSFEERTRVGVPDFGLGSDGPDTEPNVLQKVSPENLPRLRGGPSDTPVQGAASDDLATQVRAVAEAAATPASAEQMQKRASWSDLRQAVEQAKVDVPIPDSAEPPTQLRRPRPPNAEPASDRTEILRPSAGFAPASAHQRAVRPPAPSVPSFAIPQDRASYPAPIPIPRAARKTVATRAQRGPAIPLHYVAVMVGAVLLGLSPLAYFVARGCGDGPGDAPPSRPSSGPSSARPTAIPHSASRDAEPAASTAAPPPATTSAPPKPYVAPATSVVAPHTVLPNPYLSPSSPSSERCSPPYTIDDAGSRRLKIDCFEH